MERKDLWIDDYTTLNDDRSPVLSSIESLEIGTIRKAIVKHITHYGAFVDLGGTTGLIHITDLSPTPVAHPSEVVALNDDIHVEILDVDAVGRRVSVGLVDE